MMKIRVEDKIQFVRFAAILVALQLFCASCYAGALLPVDKVLLQQTFASYFAATPEARAKQTFASQLDELLLDHEEEIRQIAWQAYRLAPIHEADKADFDAKRVRFEKHISPYTLKTVGTRPAGGWPLVIALHGGGGTSQEVNDSQWRHMQIYYKDHPELGGYLYLALRAPNNLWNGFYDDYVYPLVENLIRQQVLFADVNPNKVFLIGYSHGGYGAYAIGPKIPDRFAAIHASAAAPTPDETSAKTLRNTPFSAMVGENDTTYGRAQRNREFAAQIKGLRGERTDVYPVKVEIVPNAGHGLQDRDKLVDIYPNVRSTMPRELLWEQTDGVIRNFFWLRCDNPAKKQEVNALCRDNRVTITTAPETKNITIFLDNRLVDFRRPIILNVNGQKREVILKPSLRVLCVTLLQRSDPFLAFTAQV
jgi:hypothetical protein